MEILYTAGQIEERLPEIADDINKAFPNEDKLFLVILKGAFVFAADLLRFFDNAQVDFIRTSFYQGQKKPSSKGVIIEQMPRLPLTNKHIFLVEDIVDSGKTLKKIIDVLNQQQPKSISVVSLLARDPHWNHPLVKHFFYGFSLETKKYVIGYGLDFKENNRTLPFIAIIN